MRKPLIVALASLSFTAPAISYADAPASPHTVTANLGVVTDYRFRGVSQTHENPAIQGGVDYAHASGLYLGAWHPPSAG